MSTVSNKIIVTLLLVASSFLAGCADSDPEGLLIGSTSSEAFSPSDISPENSSESQIDSISPPSSQDETSSSSGGIPETTSGGDSDIPETTSGGDVGMPETTNGGDGGTTTLTSSNTNSAINRGIAPTGTDTPKQAAARFLTQATFGPNMAEIESLANQGYDLWLDNQVSLPPTYVLPQYPRGTYVNGRQEVWWKTAVTAPDQLRQKVAYALSQIFVISDTSAVIKNENDGMSSFYDVLIKHAFGNYRDLLEEVTLHPIMGLYLSMVRNEKPDPVRGVRSDENYAREIMQLFSIGLVKLNLDGTPQLDGKGNPLPTYSQSDIENLARVFTGWTFSDCCDKDNQYVWKGNDVLNLMKPYEPFHDKDEKVIVGGVRIPAGGSAQKDLDLALDAIFNHPNVGPFISRLLIQRLTTSNPSPQYVARVASVFNNNGAGVRGDLEAVVRAILLDDEALYGHVELPYQFGKLREPLLRVTHLWRAFHPGDNNREYGYYHPEHDLGQASLRAPSVFNFYTPHYSPVGVIRDDGLKAPEFQITTESTVNTLTNVMRMFTQQDGGWKGDFPLDFSEVTALSDDTDAVIDYLDLLLMSGWMSDDMRQILTEYLNTHQLGNEETARNLIYLIMSSSEYAVQR